jgi:hypothetical protein
MEQVQTVDLDGDVTDIRFAPLSAPVSELERRCFAD